jgi:tRNA A-37 threonylcarbamoyl transferase component Bud32
VQDGGVQALKPGEVFAGYVIERVLAAGGMGEVYLAQHQTLGRVDALKVMRGSTAEDAKTRARFLREGQLAASLRHPNVVTIYNAGEFEGRLYLTMEYIQGSDLREEIDRHDRLMPRRAVWVLREAAEALDAAHRHGLVHRDVKPPNILIAQPERSGEQERVLLTDFGITKSMAANTGLTGLGEVLGTLDYVAPEQIEGAELDGRVDVYALGCVLYECLVGRAPFMGESTVAILHAHLTMPPPRPSLDAPGVPTAFDAVVARAMAKNREDRYATCGELAAAALAALPVAQETMAVPAPVFPVPAPVVAAGRSRTPLYAAGAGLAVVGVVVAGVLALGGGGTTDVAVSKPSPTVSPTVAPVASQQSTLPQSVIDAWDKEDLAATALAWPRIVAEVPGATSLDGVVCVPIVPVADQSAAGIVGCNFANGVHVEILSYDTVSDRSDREQVIAALPGTQSRETWTGRNGATGRAYLGTAPDPSGSAAVRWWTFDRDPTYAMFATWPNHDTLQLSQWWRVLPEQAIRP